MAGINGDVLLLTGDGAEVAAIGEALALAGLDYRHAVDVASACFLAADTAFDAVLLGSDQSVSAAIAFLKNSGTQVPVIVMSGTERCDMPVEAIKYVLSGALVQVAGLQCPGSGAIAAILETISRNRTRNLGARLQDEVNKLSYIADTFPECLLMIDRAGTIVYANRACYETYEYSNGALKSCNISGLLAGEADFTKLKELLRVTRSGGSNTELATISRRGQKRLSLAVITPRSDDAGAIFAYVILLQDITDSRYAETRMERLISALTSPEAGLSSLDFRDLITDPEIQVMQDTLAAAMGVSAVIVTPGGTPLNQRSNVTSLCSSLARPGTVSAQICGKCITDLAGRADAGQQARCTCPCTGMTEVAIPLVVNGKPAAFWIVGQVSLGEPAREKLQDLLTDQGISPADVRNLIAGVHRMTEHQLNQIVATFSMVADKVTRLAIQNFRQGKYINERNTTLEELQRSERRLQEMSYRDGLTGLHNRAYFEQELGRLESASSAFPVSIVAADVDGLKLINDTLGHTAGDQHLKVAGNMISAVFSASGDVCRTGGDEFCILLPGCGEAAAGKMLELLREEIRRYNERQPGPPLSISTGIAAINPGESLYDAYKRADRLMYEHKLKRDDYARSKSIDMILLSLSERDYMDHGHTRVLTVIVDAMASELGLGEDARANLKLLARLHDLGKIGVPDEIVMKPAKLDEHEWVLMRSHVEIGANIASRSLHMNHIAPLIRHHHERYDGTGYPSGLSGSQIPLECRIMAIADSYDAMIADRPYRKGLSHECALEEILRNAGTQFDPEIVKVFAGIVRSGRL
ncbi:HD domain-containing phosphohydrolase [Methanocella arvoryzae]|uniref:Signal transduction protein n=1 Tax=Methanocella arvoryzae (strain DSM 22066 / NBRC 105507 / MRE50) TaxID=351160 RepID=Q0W2L1_METAR|nr:HD domain-containing phosphohydrolase [Methanocella arvoryzae]CAJ37382.1 putative signal transduction protein [Methanocella arvoryzae MRE50]